MNIRHGKLFHNLANRSYIAEAVHDSRASAVLPGHRLFIVLVAAVIALFLLGAGVVAVIYGDSIQNWFGYHWDRVTGQTMSESHSAVIDHLSQEIGVSQTIEDVTVTVDSATVGDNILYLLLRVEGQKLNSRHTYSFEQFDMKVTPDPLENSAGMGGIGLQFDEFDSDGAALFLIKFKFGSRNGFELDKSPLDVQVKLGDLIRTGGKEKVIQAGEWSMTFTIDRTRLPEPITLSDTEITVYGRDDALETVLFSDMELTSTGIRFRHDLEVNVDLLHLVQAPEHIKEMAGTNLVQQMYVILENDAIIESSGGVGVAMHDIGKLSCSYHWKIPINLDEVTAIQIGQTQIKIP